jgi:gliding motility-associated-like protein
VTLCDGDSTTVVASGQFLNPGEVSSYILHTNPGTPAGTILAQNKTGRFGFIPGMSYDVTYYISAVAGNNLGGFPDPNDPCLSVSQGRPVIFKRYPTPNAGINIGVCGPSAFLNSGFSLYPGAWSYITGPGSATITTPQNNTSAVNVSVLGTYTFRWTEANGICIASDEVQATFWDSPAPGSPVISCNSTNTGYTVSFSITGGSSPYTVTGLTGSFSGNTFTSSVLTNGSAYSFSVKDVNGCQASVVSGSHTCPCATYAGTMSVTPLVFCASDPATAVWYNDATLDGDDVVGFILHSTPDATPGTVYAANTQPTFPLSAGLSTGTTYYISAIAGSLLNGTINLSDPCLSISPGTPVQWKPMPQATLSGTTSICRGESTNLTFSGTGAYPLSVTYSDGSGSQIVNLFGPQSVNIPVSPTQNTVYTIQSVSDGTLPVCSTSPVQSVTVTVNQPVNAGTATAPAELCSGTGSTIKLTDLVNGEDPGGFWSVASGNPVQGGFNAAAGTFNPVAQSPGTYIFRYNVDAAAPCPDQSAEATVIIQQTPTADAGPDLVINCLQGTVTLNGNSSSGGTGVVYNWTFNGSSAGATPVLTVNTGGTYQLQVSNTAGCSDSDEAVVTLDPDRPSAQLITVENISCFGESDGSIAASGVVSGKPPVLYSLDGVNFTQNGLFTQLRAGVYTVTLQDATGCEWESGLLTVTEPPSVQPYITDEVRVVLGDQVNLEAIVTAPLSSLASIEWKPLLDTLNKGTLIQRFIPLQSLSIDLEITDTAGCFARDRVQVLVEKPNQIYIPGVFKPGSQNLNDVFLIYCGRTVESIELLQIYDRWGEHLFEVQNAAPNDPASAWDGIYNGQIVMPGVYVYVARIRLIDGTVKTYTGDVTVLR